MRKLDRIETLVTIGDMTNEREVTEIDFYNCMCLYFQFDSIYLFSEFVRSSNSAGPKGGGGGQKGHMPPRSDHKAYLAPRKKIDY